MSRNNGFTLLELLVALALLAILITALYGTFFSLTSARDRAEEVAEKSRELSGTLDKLRCELAAAYYKSAPSADPAVTPRFRFEVEDRDFFGKPASVLSFTTISAPADGPLPVSDQTLVEYRPTVREQSIALVRGQKDAYAAGEPLAYTQVETLEGFLVECSNDGSKWQRTWSARLNQGLPKYVRVTLHVKEGEKTMPYAAIISPRMVR